MNCSPELSTRFFPERSLIETNLRRRHLNSFERVELAYPLLGIEKSLAELREKAGVKLEDQAKQVTLTSNEVRFSDELLQKKDAHDWQSSAVVAEKAGVSRATFERGVAVIERGSEELKKQVRSGKKTSDLGNVV